MVQVKRQKQTMPILKKDGKAFSMILSSDYAYKGNSHDFRIRFTPELNMSGGDLWQVALEKLDTWNTWYNISDDYDNRVFTYYNGTAWKDLNIEPGIYSADDLIAIIDAGVVANSDDPNNLVFSINLNTQKFVLTLASGYKIDMTNKNIRVLFGAQSKIYDTSGSFESVAKMTNNVNAFVLHCDLLANSVLGGNQSEALEVFTPDVAPGESIALRPNLSYNMVRPGKAIRECRIWCTDQLGRPLNLNNEPLTIKLHFRSLSKE